MINLAKLIVSITLLISFSSLANESDSSTALPVTSTSTPNLDEDSSILQKPSLLDDPNRPISNQVKFYNFSAMYVGQWLVFGASQFETIRDYGSFKNMGNFMFDPIYDRDDFGYNVFKHSLSGMLYYQFYRYRGYSKVESFTWSFISSLAFEFLIETYTEKPSIQDIYQTPIFGTILGMMIEPVSERLRAHDFIFLKGLGYVLNPFSLLPDLDVHAMPLISKEQIGYNVVWSF